MIWKSPTCQHYLFVQTMEDEGGFDDISGAEITNLASFVPVEVDLRYHTFFVPLFIRKHWVRGISLVVVIYQVRVGLASPFLHIQQCQWTVESGSQRKQCVSARRQREWVSLVPAGIIGFNLQTHKTAAPTELHPPKASARPAWITKHSLSACC